MSEIVAFYRGEAVHPDGLRLRDVLEWDDDALAIRHNYIQWLFPLRKASEQVPNSPIISTAEIGQFRSDPALRRAVLQSFERMLRFYGFRIAVDQHRRVVVVRGEDFESRTDEWLRPANHNYRRISRILESLRLLGLGEMSLQFFRALSDLYREDSSPIGWTTFSYWKEAARE